MTIAFNVLEKNQEIYGNYFLEASAGTGKTFTIAHLVLRFIIDAKDPIAIQKIATVTFTKAAASELKMRIKALLLEAKNLFEANRRYSFQDQTCDLKECLFKVNLALSDFELAQISTIHAFSFQILKTFSLDLGCALHIKSQEETSCESLAFDLIKEVLFSVKLDNYLHPKQKVAWLNYYRGDLEQAVFALRQKLLSGFAFEEVASWESQELGLKKSLEELPPIPEKEPLIDYISCFKISPITQADCLEEIENFYRYFEEEGDLSLLLVKKSFFEALVPLKLKVKLKTPPDQTVENFVRYFQTKLRPKINECLDPARIELFLLNFLKPELNTLLDSKGVLSYQKMLEVLTSHLDNISVIKKINQQFDCVIIDEFQDTDPIQWNICKKLFVDSPVKAFYMVGDPKQAIYGFRAADVYTYLSVSETCPNIQKRTLDTCFRSSKPFIDSLNKFLSYGLWLDLPYLNKSLDYQPVKAGRSESSHSMSAFQFYLLESSESQCEAQMVDLAVNLKKQYPDESCAILVKDRFQADRVEESLKALSMTADLVKNETLDQSALYDLVLSFINWLEGPYDLKNLYTFLSSKWFTCSWNDLCKLEENLCEPLWQTRWKESLEYFSNNGLNTSIEHFLNFNIPQSSITVRQKICGLYGLEIASKLHFITAHLFTKAKPFHSLVKYRLELEQLKKQAFKIPTLPAPSSSITVMTSHMSKGLEFDHVITLGIATRHKGNSNLIIKRAGSSCYLGRLDSDERSKLSLADLEAEKLRQQYVAITRAKTSVHIPVINYQEPVERMGELAPLEIYLLKIKYPEEPLGTLYEKASNQTFKDLVLNIFKDPCFTHLTNIQIPDKQSESNTLTLLDQTKTAAVASQNLHLSFSSLKSETLFHSVEDPLKGRDYGDFFHMIMQNLFETGLYLDSESADCQAYLLQMIHLSPFKDHKDLILHHIKSTLSLPFRVDQDVFTLKDIPQNHILVEQPFSYICENGYMKGFIDCIILFKNKVIFTDWKTSLLHDPSEKGVLEHMKEASYLLQLDIYQEALKRMEQYFYPRKLAKAFYVFVKQGLIFEKNLEALPCLI